MSFGWPWDLIHMEKKNTFPFISFQNDELVPKHLPKLTKLGSHNQVNY